MKRAIVAALISTWVFSPVLADQGERIPPPRDPLYLKECGGCHLAFPPFFLPARSWEKLLAGLDDHFGENAALSPEVVQQLGTYLAGEAGDAEKGGRRYLRDLPPGETPLRISETPYWRHEHGEREARGMYAQRKMTTWADCAACHRGAEQGDYEVED